MEAARRGVLLSEVGSPTKAKRRSSSKSSSNVEAAVDALAARATAVASEASGGRLGVLLQSGAGGAKWLARGAAKGISGKVAVVKRTAMDGMTAVFQPEASNPDETTVFWP